VNLELQHNVYNSIDDLPIFNWDKITKESMYQFLFVETPKYPYSPINALKIFRGMFNEYLERFALKDYNEILLKKIEIHQYKADLILTKDKSLKTMIQIAQLELKELTKTAEEKSDLERDLVTLELGLNRPVLNSKEISTSKFFTYVERLKELAGQGIYKCSQ